MKVSPIAHAPSGTPEKPLNLRKVSWGDLVWLDITDPGMDAKEYLARNYNFHPLDLDDCFSGRQLSKIDEYQDYIFILLHFPIYEKARKRGTTVQWSAFLSDKFLVTLHPSSLSPISDVMRECEASEENKREFMGHGSGYLMYLILDRVTDSYFPVLDAISAKTDGLEESVFNERIEAAREISNLRQDILRQRRVMFPTRRLMSEMESKLKRFANFDMSAYYGDLMDHMNKITDALGQFQDTVEVFKDADYVLSGYRANRLIRTIATMVAVALPFIIVTSVYVLLPAGVKGSLSTSIACTAAAVVGCAIALFILRKRNLL